MKIRVDFADGTSHESVAGPFAQIAVERRFDCLYTDIFDEEGDHARIEHFYYLGYAALIRDEHPSVEGLDLRSTEDFDGWMRDVVDVEPVVERKRTSKKTGAKKTGARRSNPPT